MSLRWLSYIALPFDWLARASGLEAARETDAAFAAMAAAELGNSIQPTPIETEQELDEMSTSTESGHEIEASTTSTTTLASKSDLVQARLRRKGMGGEQ
ncbi:uncharacterized protein CLAFUR5_04855 [Fulvia fulva]|uniref:Uncharacterized protein n=1 Tax=Passalora fulva TaxID=5499 RepID=A0A9Q8P7K1_PASFU|nr:uncharacterized protein CLAFUR5_04855 [Fulvia fulva]UJO16230.1 hypothetical protein CLAFUR5_04855 [Fulvia fulva]